MKKKFIYSHTQRQFLKWISCERNISLKAATFLYQSSMQSIRGGHSGSAYRRFCDQSYHLFEVFVSDIPKDLDNAYRFHHELHFLRMLSYPEPSDLYVTRLVDLSTYVDTCTIVDYGCGLAHLSRAVARKISDRGFKVNLVLADIPTPRLDFLKYSSRWEKYTTTVVRCAANKPARILPGCNILFATEFLEHVYSPIDYMSEFHRALRPRGLLVTNLKRHRKEFMHVSPELFDIYAALRRWKYKTIKRYELFTKQ